ncbi:transposase [Streptomyces sp. NPDC057888]|uniref:transposase n=1 Tax=Streptomyces sp. NPDC057888 TaxID=3346271 RepID=UPI0036B359F8
MRAGIQKRVDFSSTSIQTIYPSLEFPSSAWIDQRVRPGRRQSDASTTFTAGGFTPAPTPPAAGFSNRAPRCGQDNRHPAVQRHRTAHAPRGTSPVAIDFGRLPAVQASGRPPHRGAPPAPQNSIHPQAHRDCSTTPGIHLAADSRRRPLRFHLTPGQAGDSPAFDQVMASNRVPRRVGQPRTRPNVVLTDKAHSSRVIRDHLRRRRIRAVIPEPADQIANRKRKGRNSGRPPGFDRDAYKRRNTVGRCINRLKQWRGLATRYEKTATVFHTALHIAGIFLRSAR